MSNAEFNEAALGKTITEPDSPSRVSEHEAIKAEIEKSFNVAVVPDLVVEAIAKRLVHKYREEEIEKLIDLLTSIRYHCQVQRIDIVGNSSLPCYKVAIRDELWERIRVAVEGDS